MTWILAHLVSLILFTPLAVALIVMILPAGGEIGRAHV